MSERAGEGWIWGMGATAFLWAMLGLWQVGLIVAILTLALVIGRRP